MDTFTIKTEGVNVEAIMQEIHQRVLEKKQAGIYTDEELQRITQLKQDLSPKHNERQSEMSLHLRKLHRNWDAAASGGAISSHRKTLGPLIVSLKCVGFKVLRFFGAAFFTRQTEFNAAAARFNTVALDELTRLNEEIKQLQRAQQELVTQIELLRSSK